MNQKTSESEIPVLLTKLPIFVPQLDEGLRWIGIVSLGHELHHVILLPGDFRGNWNESVAWAKEQRGDLPTRLEQALIWANAPGAFEKAWYWSCEQYASDPSYAWIQSFYYGVHIGTRKDDNGRARAVRRLPIL